MERTPMGEPGRKLTGRKLTVSTTVRKAWDIIVMVFNVLRGFSTVLTLKAYAENGDAASSAHTVLTAVVNLGKILFGLDN